MRSMKLIGFWLTVCLPLTVLADSTALVPSERALREECSEFSQAGMRDCLAEKAENSQKALRRAENEAMNILSKWFDKKYISQSKTALAASSKSFAKYRDSHCKFMASLSGGGAGNSHEIGRLACVAELNNRRVEQLRDALSDLPLE